MGFDKETRLHEEHYKDLQRQAEQYRLVQLALAGRPHRPSPLSRLFIWLKELITNLRCIVQGKIGGRAEDSPVPAYQNPCGDSV